MYFYNLFNPVLFSRKMKRIKIIILLLFSFGFSGVYSQSPTPPPTYRYFNETDAGIAFGLGQFKTNIVNGSQEKIKNDQTVYSVQTINGVLISDRAGIGIGVGAEFWSNAMFYPVFAHLFYNFKASGSTPFAAVSLGEAFGKRDSTQNYPSGKGGFYAGLSGGYKMKAGKHFFIEYEAFYRFQSVRSTYLDIYVAKDESLHSATVNYNVPYHFFGIRIGMVYR